MKKQKKIVIIAAMTASDHLMGNEKEEKQVIPWHLPEDFKHFKNTTMGSAMIMGRKTLQSLPGLLPGRPHIYLSRSTTYSQPGAYHAFTLKQAREIAYDRSDSDTIYIIGGAEIIDLACKEDWVDEMIITKIHARIPVGDNPIYFPDIFDKFEIIEDSNILVSENSTPAHLKYRIITYKKQKS